MEFEFRKASTHELEIALAMLKEAAKKLQTNNINQWEYWLNPPQEKINWIEEGFHNNEFYFITQSDTILGMFRLLDEDHLYWGVQDEKAKYIHSLVIKEAFTGHQLGKRVIEKLGQLAIQENTFLLRLDCNAENHKLCTYYEKQGFTKVREKQMPLSLNNLYEKRLISLP